MAFSNRRWLLSEPAPPAFIAALPDLPPLLATLLYQRQIRTPAAIEAFLRHDHNGLHNPFLLKDMERAARRIAQAIAGGEPMAVYGDFDTDGVTAVTLLMQAIPAFGGKLRPYIPHREREGYGLNVQAVEQLHADGIRLLITVDCGVSNADEVARAQALGLDVIVTDHHAPPATLPAAYALINPKQPGCAYPFKGLVGVGLAYKLVQALWRLGLRAELSGRDLLDVVALGTIADMGPLVDENRALVRKGLEALNATQRPGMRALVESAGLALGKVDATAVAFLLGPRINAAGRLDDAILAYRLLLADSLDAARELAQALNEANRQRQSLTQAAHDVALAQAAAKSQLPLVLLESPDFAPGIVGLVAGRLADDLGRPVVLIARGGETSRGSARSIPGFDIVAALEQCAPLLVRYGGHAQAAGFTVANQHIPTLEQQLLAIAQAALPPASLGATLRLDAALPLAALDWPLMQQLERLEPFGQQNPRPNLLSRAVRVGQASAVGADGRTLRLRLSTPGAPAAARIDAIGFRMGQLAPLLTPGRLIDVAYRFEINEWRDDRRLQLRLLDLRPSA
jgi:single-stranded-DNA-specific exonuclease